MNLEPPPPEKREKRETDARLLNFTASCAAFIDALANPLCIVDMDYNIVIANKAFSDFFGVHDFKNMRCHEITKCKRHQEDACPGLKSLDDDRPGELEMFHPGLKKRIRIQVSPIWGEGVPIGLIHTMTDVTELRETVEEYAEVSSRLDKSLQEAQLSREAFLNMLEDLTEAYHDLEELFMGLVRAMISTLDAKSHWTRGHSERVSGYAVQIARRLGLEDEEIKNIELAGLLHDIGKVGTYDSILDKPGKLSDEEFALIRKHPAQGADILKGTKQMHALIPTIRGHHERMDGRGYPDGLKGEDIPLSARIMHVADTFDAIMADRPYRSSPGLEYAMSELKKWSGIQFDPNVVEAFLALLSEANADAMGKDIKPQGR